MIPIRAGSQQSIPIMRRRRATSDEPGFQITPMIDMTFLLLIFFMVTQRMSKEQVNLQIRLPVASAAMTPEDVDNRDIINIDGQGRYHASGRVMDRDEIADYLKRRLEAHPPLQIYVRADLATPGRQIKELMEMAAEAGAVNVIFGSYNQ